MSNILFSMSYHGKTGWGYYNSGVDFLKSLATGDDLRASDFYAVVARRLDEDHYIEVIASRGKETSFGKNWGEESGALYGALLWRYDLGTRHLLKFGPAVFYNQVEEWDDEEKGEYTVRGGGVRLDYRFKGYRLKAIPQFLLVDGKKFTDVRLMAEWRRDIEDIPLLSLIRYANFSSLGLGLEYRNTHKLSENAEARHRASGSVSLAGEIHDILNIAIGEALFYNSKKQDFITSPFVKIGTELGGFEASLQFFYGEAINTSQPF